MIRVNCAHNAIYVIKIIMNIRLDINIKTFIYTCLLTLYLKKKYNINDLHFDEESSIVLL